jgi:acyl dehydratase
LSWAAGVVVRGGGCRARQAVLCCRCGAIVLVILFFSLEVCGMRTFASLDEFVAAKGESLGFSEWHKITQEQVNAFADATGDHQWIHVDIERAASGPFGGTIAHGYLTVSLLPILSMEIFGIEKLTMGINYGLDRVRFPSPVLTGSSIRAEATLTDVKQTHLGSLASVRMRVEIEGQEKAACVADTLSLFVA